MNPATVVLAMGQLCLTDAARIILPLISLSLLPLVLALCAVYRVERHAGLDRWKALLHSFRLVAGLALLAGLVHWALPSWMPDVAAWRGWGLHSDENWPRPPAAVLASREERVRKICELWKAIAAAQNGEPAPARNSIQLDPERWVVPGEGGPIWHYLQRGESFVLVEPYPIDGEQLATSNGQEARPIRIDELQEIAGLWRRSGL